MKLSILAALLLSSFLSCGCVHTSVKSPDGIEFNRTAVGYQAQFKSVKYGDFEVEGYDGRVDIDKLIDALGAIR